MSAPQAPTKLSNKSRNTLMQILALGLVTLALTLQWHQQLGGPIVAQELGHAGIHFTVVSARPNPSTGAVRVLLRPVGQALPAGLHNGAIELYLSAAQLAMVGVTAAQLSAMATVHIARFEVRRFFLNPQLIQWELIPVTGFALRNGALGPFPPPLAAPAPAMSLARAVACWRCSGGVVAVFWAWSPPNTRHNPFKPPSTSQKKRRGIAAGIATESLRNRCGIAFRGRSGVILGVFFFLICIWKCRGVVVAMFCSFFHFYEFWCGVFFRQNISRTASKHPVRFSSF
jgi:hypothetical protein